MQETTPTRRPAKVEFSGTAGEYFGIWLPNMLLTIVTLGVYSPWAKVRNTQYLYGHTAIEGGRFAYTADPVDILKGRAIALALLVVYLLIASFAPPLEPVFLAALFVLFPWVVVRALRYRYRNTLYRNVRFDFTGRYDRAFGEFVLAWLALIPTFGLAYPYIRWRQSRYVLDNSRFGTTPFAFAAPAAGYYRIFLMPLVTVLVLLVVFVVIGLAIAPALAPLLGGDSGEPEVPPNFGLWLLLGNLVVYLTVATIALYIGARVRNLVFDTAALGEHGFRSTVSVRRLLWLWSVNLVAVVATLGLAWPWARVRLARYYARCTQVLVAGDLDAFVGRSAEESRALGEEMGEVFDLDIGL